MTRFFEATCDFNYIALFCTHQLKLSFNYMYVINDTFSEKQKKGLQAILELEQLK